MFFPLMQTPQLQGFLDLLNAPPNNWEKPIKRTAHIYLLWPSNNKWESRKIASLEPGESKRILSADFVEELGTRNVAFIYPTSRSLPRYLEKLPSERFWYSEFPAWRCTSGFQNEFTQVSYQSDLEPLPTTASLMTFHPFIQYSEIRNYLVVLNLVKEPTVTQGPIHFFSSSDYKYRGTETIQTNSVSVIDLDKYNFSPDELPVFISPKVAGIPFGLGVKNDNKMLSLEHTHPPASLVLFGDRRTVQGKIKKEWMGRLIQNVQN